MQGIVTKVIRDAKETIKHETRQTTRLEKLEYLADDLTWTHKKTSQQRDKMAELKTKTSTNYKEFDQARADNLQECSQQVHSKQAELQVLQEEVQTKTI